MDIETIKKVVTDQARELERKLKEGDLIDREQREYVAKFLKYPNIAAILGVRRCGKSVFALLLSKQVNNKACYINFDDERLFGFKAKDLNNVLQAFYELYGTIELIILDEVQNVPGWELFANRLRETKKIIITGSNSNLLSGELSTHLTGRHIDFTLYPFSFREILNFKPDIYSTEDRAKVRSELDKYIKGSSFPEFKKFGSDIVIRIYEDIINKDCLRRYKIKNEQTFRELSKYLISNFASEFTYSKLSKIFKIKDVHTTKNYVSYLKEAFLIIVLERFSPKLKQQMIAPKKLYLIDHGLGNFIGFKLSDNIGKFLENIVCIELSRKKSIDRSMEIYYWKSIRQEEVDFIIKYGNKISQLIQVCYDISNLATKEREIKALLKASEELKCKNIKIVTWDYEVVEKHGGKEIIFVPLWKWLLEESL